MQIKGIKRGNIIEISENLNIPDGSEVLIEVPEASPPKKQHRPPLFGSDRGLITTSDDFDEPLELLPSRSDEERLKRLNQVFGAWKDDTELEEIFDEIDRERHNYFGRKIDSLDD